MVVGVSEGHKKMLDLMGVGYRRRQGRQRAEWRPQASHPREVAEIEGITIDVPSQNQIVISGPDKQKVGQFAANVREKRPRALQGQGHRMLMKPSAAR